MTHETFRELLPLYVIGALDPAERDEFEQYVAANRNRCEAELAEYQAVANQIALAAPPAEPSRAVFDRIMAAIEEKPTRVSVAMTREQEGPDLRTLIFRWVPWAAAVALCVLVLVMTDQLRTVNEQYRALSERHTELRDQFMDQRGKITELTDQVEAQSREFKNQTDQLRAKNEEQRLDVEALRAANGRLAQDKAELIRTADELRMQLDRQNLQVASLETKLAEQTASLQLLMDPAIRVAQMKHPKDETKAVAKVYWHDAKKTGLIVASNLEPILAGGDKCLQLWVICGNEAPVPAGIGWTDPSGHTILKITPGKEVACADKFAVTVEPAGGLPMPTGPMVLLGE